jgi:uncharacterized protein
MSRLAIPLSQFVLKVHSRCDLACDHCYVYQAADQSWRGQPMAMSDEVIAQAALRIAEHAKLHQLGEVQVVLHGGEPLLAGAPRLELIARALRSAVDGICGLDLRIHTNGVQLDERFCDLFGAQGVKVGISVDGYRAANDRHRRYADGRSSYDQVARAIGLLRTPRYRDLYAGLLCTIDVANDPVAVYEALVELDPPRIDFLLPHATWDEPPARPAGTPSEYADWLIAIFDRWQAGGRPVQVRTFDSIISTSNGGASLTEALGLGPSSLAVIETDGSYEQADSLKAAFDGAPATGFNVFSHSLDTVRQHPGIAARQQGLAGLCGTCRACPVVTSCGGGLYAHRYRSGAGFGNPSVYCPDLLKLITHVRDSTGQEGPGGGPARAAAGIPVHALPDAEFRALAAGFGGATAIGQLAGAQRSLGRALLAAVYRAGHASAAGGMDARASAAGHGTGTADLAAAWNLLTSIDQHGPHILAEVLGHPYVRVWAVRCLEQLKLSARERVPGGQALAADLRHLNAIAAAAAIRSGMTARLTVPVVAGAVHLPTLGRLVVRAPEPATAGIEITGGNVKVLMGDRQWTLATAGLLPGAADAGNSESACWHPARRLTAPGISVALEDTDPYRDCHQWPASPRLTGAQFAGWQLQFQRAWAEIQQQHGAYAAALAAGLGTIMPLAAAPASQDVSATARHAFGAVAAALPDDPVTLALLLIHEFQHVKLGAVLDLYDLYDVTDDRLFPAPWREDPRPLEGLLQGTYAHVAVVDFWRARRDAAVGSAADAAAARFTRWHAHTVGAIDTLTASGSLTPLGSEFVAEMRRSLTAGPRSRSQSALAGRPA